MNKYKLDDKSNKLREMKNVKKNIESCLKSMDLESNSRKRTIPGDGLLKRSNTVILLRFDFGSSSKEMVSEGLSLKNPRFIAEEVGESA